MKKLLKGLLIFMVLLLVLAISTITTLDKTPARDLHHYQEMMDRLDSIPTSSADRSLFHVGFSKVSLTPDSLMEMAGYGNRNPKLMEGVLDSIFVRTIVIKNEEAKAAIVTADLLTIHPKMRDAVYAAISDKGWEPEEIFFTATHTHCSIGQWAPGLVGSLFAGNYHTGVAVRIAEKIAKSIMEAEQIDLPGALGFSESSNPDLVLNRLVHDQGIIDPHLKNLEIQTDQGKVGFFSFSAHATCFNHHMRDLTGDFPSYFNRALAEDTSLLFTSYAAGAVASMGPATPNLSGHEKAQYLGEELSTRINFSDSYDTLLSIAHYKVPLSLGSPQFKISEDFILRPYLFEKAFGAESSDISVLRLNNTLLIGTPCDFSGELAMPLYDYARNKGLNLIITSFNGGYIGYITADEWYESGKYETLTMNWYGPGNGAYFTDIIKRIIDAAG